MAYEASSSRGVPWLGLIGIVVCRNLVDGTFPLASGLHNHNVPPIDKAQPSIPSKNMNLSPLTILMPLFHTQYECWARKSS